MYLQRSIQKSIVAVITILSLQSFGQPAGRAVVDQGILWSSYSSNLKITPGTTLFLDGHFRFASSDGINSAFEPMQILLRSHVDFKIKGKLTFAPFGYGYIPNFQYGKQPVSIVNNERRIYQQIAWSHSWGKTTIGHRLRTEERFIQEHDSNNEIIGFTNRQFRVRYRFIATRPLGKDKVEPGTFFAQTFYEGFISRGKKITFDNIDQNRFFLGLGYQPVKDLNLSLGWYYQMLVKANGAKQENNYGLLLMAVQTLDLTTKK